MSYPDLPIILVDDERAALAAMSACLLTRGIDNTIELDNGREVLPTVEKLGASAIFLDLGLPDLSGENVLAVLGECCPEVPVVVVTAVNDVNTAVECMKRQAIDYLVKPVEADRLLAAAGRALELGALRREVRSLRACQTDGHIPALKNPAAFAPILTRDPRMLAAFAYAEAVAVSSQPVLITGETGSGKELFARAIHQASNRTGEFLAVNVAGLDDRLFADTLFGHLPGAYTGAGDTRPGLVQLASGGTLFLDEIGDLSAESQVKLLRLLQEREYLPLGADRPRRSEARVIAATNRDPEGLRRSPTFRADLFYRLAAHQVQVPPLRERAGDLPLLVAHFLTEAASELGRQPAAGPEIVSLLSRHAFPGNVRELRALIHDAVARSTTDRLTAEVFPPELRSNLSAPEPDEALVWDATLGRMRQLPSLKECRRQLVSEALRRTGGNQTAAARLLGVTRQAISKYLKNNQPDL